MLQTEVQPLILYALSLTWLDYMLQVDVQSFDLLVPPSQPVRLHDSKGGLNF